MSFEEWLDAQGFEPGEMTAQQKGVLRALYERTYGAPAVDVEAPMKNHHVAELRSSGDFDDKTFRLTKDGTLYGKIPVPDDVGVLWGKLKGRARDRDMPLAVSIRFPAAGWTVKRAKAWLSKHGVKFQRFYAATATKAEAPQSLPFHAAGSRQLELLSGPGELEILAAKAADADGDGDKPKLGTFKAVAYTGGAMRVSGWLYPVVIDLDGLKLTKRARPVLKEHDRAAIVGHTTVIEKTDVQLRAEGVISGTGGAAQEVIETAQNGFPWRASVGARADKMVFVEAGNSEEANRKTWKGPVYIVRKAMLGEISFVVWAADDDTSTKVAASSGDTGHQETDMEFAAWLKEKGFDPDTITAEQRTTLEAAWKLSQKPADPPAGKTDPPAGEVEGKAPTEDEIRAAAVAEAVKAERARTAKIEAACKGLTDEAVGSLKAKALAGDIDLETLQAGLVQILRDARPNVKASTGEDRLGQQKMLLAAAYHAGSLEPERIIAVCGEPALDAASKLRGMGLQEFCGRVAAIDGVELPRYQGNSAAWLTAAFSTMTLPGILSNVANTFLLAGFTSVEDTWRRIASIRSVANFQTVTSYRMTGDFQFEEIGPDGELKHAAVAEEEFSNQAKTYGRMFGLTRHDLINDDLGAFAAIPQRIGRGAALKLNLEFWTEFMNNAAFFTAALGNYAAGAGTALTIAGLTAAHLLFMNQTDPDGHPLGSTAKIILVPPAKLVAATQIVKSPELRDTTASTKAGTTNPHAGNFSTEMSTYLSNAAITGNSAKAWYLLAAPADLATIEVAFLNGQQSPIVEQAEADFNVLGIQLRGYFDFGVALQEHRAGNKSKGEA